MDEEARGEGSSFIHGEGQAVRRGDAEEDWKSPVRAGGYGVRNRRMWGPAARGGCVGAR